MPKIPILSAKEFERILLNLGFQKIRQKGSHVFYRHFDGRYTTLPHHPGRDLAKPLIAKIIKEINLSLEEFIKEI